MQGATTICVHVLAFAAYREILGTHRMKLDVPEGATPEDVFRALEQREPRLAELRSSTTFAVNREVAPPGTPLRHGDELALLQPVSGGGGD